MRRLKKRGPAAETMTITPEDVATVPASAAAVATVEPAKALPALAGTLAELGKFTRQENLEPAGGMRVPYVGFISGKEQGDRPAALKKDLGTTALGTPYAHADGTHYGIGTAAYTIIAEFPYWATLDNKNSVVDCWLTPRPFGAEFGGLTIKDCVLAVTLVLPGSAPLHEDLQPALATLTDFRGVKCPAAKQHLDAIEQSETPEWAKANGPLAAAVPPRFRIASTFKIQTKTASSGFAYALVGATPEPASFAQVQAISDWWEDKDCRGEMQAVEAAFEKRVNFLKADAAATAKKTNA